MRVRAAGALLLAPLFAITYSAMQAVGLNGGNRSLLRVLFWRGSGLPQEDVWLIVRDGIFGLVLLVGIIAIFGPRFSRWLVALVGIVLIVLYVPWIVYDLGRSQPPSWLFDHYPWYYPARSSAIMLTAVSALAVILAVTDRDPRYRRAQGQPRHAQPRQGQSGGPQATAPLGYPTPPGYQPPPQQPQAAATPPGYQPPPQQPQPAAPPGGPAAPPPSQPAPPPPPPSANPPDAPSSAADDPTATSAQPGSPPTADDDPTRIEPRVDPDER